MTVQKILLFKNQNATAKQYKYKACLRDGIIHVCVLLWWRRPRFQLCIQIFIDLTKIEKKLKLTRRFTIIAASSCQKTT